MQHFRVNSGEAQKLYRQIYQREDDAWDMLEEGEEHEVSDGYDLRRTDNRLSLYMKVRKLKQGGHDYKAVLGPDTTLDQVSFQNEHRDTCDCIIETMWSKGHECDSHPDYGRQTFPHASHRHCDVHSHMQDDHVVHHHELHAENWHKNHTVCELAEHLEVMPTHIKWKHVNDRHGKRTLVVSHPKLADGSVRGHATFRIANHPKASKRPVHITHEE